LSKAFIPRPLEKPLLRGYSHLAAFFFSMGASTIVVATSQSLREFIALLIYSICLITLFGISSLYHLPNWNPKYRQWMKRLDHCSIYLMIAGTGTPLALIGMPPESGIKFLILTWSVCLFGILQSLFWVNCPKWVSAMLYLIAGWIVVPFWSDIKAAVTTPAMICLILGGIAYTVGALSYALRKPSLWPRVFGYHEIFHIFVILGAVFQFIFVFQLLPTRC
jgi:hemolysin III